MSSLSAGSEEVLREHARGHQAGDHRARGADPGGAREGEGPSRRASERPEGGAADVRRGLHAPGHSQRSRRSRIPGLTARGRAASARRPLRRAGPAAPRRSSPPRVRSASAAGRPPRKPTPPRDARALADRHARSEPDGDRLRARRRATGSWASPITRTIPGGRPLDPARRRAGGRAPRSVASLRPDLVLADRGGKRARRRDRARGRRHSRPDRSVRAPSTPCWTGIRLRRASGWAADEAGTGWSRAFERRRQRRVRARRRRGGRRPRAVFSSGPIRLRPPEAGRSWTICSREAGAENLAREARTGWPVVSAEYLATAPVDVLVVPDSAARPRAPTSAPSRRARSPAAHVARARRRPGG